MLILDVGVQWVTCFKTLKTTAILCGYDLSSKLDKLL